MVRGQLFAEGAASLPRPDISSDGVLGFGFNLKRLSGVQPPASAAEVQASVTGHGSTAQLTLTRSAHLAMDLAALSPAAARSFLDSLENATRDRLTALLVPHASTASIGQNQRAPLCVVTYAQDAGAWFPYFHRYYARIAGPEALYVITPKPESFSAYRLGGLISAANLQFDDRSRAHLMSSFATGLQSYYEWSLVCDVDEIVMPFPGSGQSFLDALKASKDDLILSRGLDVLQGLEDAAFDLDRPVLEQRRYAVPNTAMCKPHLARVPVRYSGGHHYCQKPLGFSPAGTGFVTLHLKWACRTMREALTRIVQATAYAVAETATYCSRSAAPETLHPLATASHLSAAQSLLSPAMQGFEQDYVANLAYDPTRDLWVGKHVVAQFVVDLHS